MNPSSDAVVGIIGILLGFVFGEISASVRDAQTIRRQILTTRAMLRYEIAHNQQRLQTQWQRLNPQGKPPDGPSQATYFAEQLFAAPFAPFGRDIFYQPTATVEQCPFCKRGDNAFCTL